MRLAKTFMQARFLFKSNVIENWYKKLSNGPKIL